MANFIPNDAIEEIRQQANLVDIVSQYVQLSKKGRNYMGLCPFHEERTPSFSVSEEKQLYHCFSCGRGGNVFKFLMDLDEISFPEAVKQVAAKINYQLPTEFVNSATTENSNFNLRKMYAATKEFYQHILVATKTGEVALNYLKERKLQDETIKIFDLGFAPNTNNVLLEYLKQQNFTPEQLRESGLFVENERGELFDRFRDRIMFPLKDQSGQTIAFSGRRLSNNDQEAKYLNSPETKIFTKSQLLFNFDQAKIARKNEQHLILYEGYMDVISAFQAGIKSGVASMGTSLTDEQIYLLRRATKQILINYDGDQPGQNATMRAISLFQKKAPQLDLGIVVLPEQLDPDEFIKKYGLAKYQQELNGALTPIEFKLLLLKQKYNLNNDREKLSYIDEALKAIAIDISPIAQEVYLEQLGQELNITQDALKAALLKERRKQRQIQKNTQPSPYQTDQPAPELVEAKPLELNTAIKAQIRILFLIMHHEEVYLQLLQNDFVFPNKNFEKIFNLWHNYMSANDMISVNSFLDNLPEELKRIVVYTEMLELPLDYQDQELVDLQQSLTRISAQEQIALLQQQIAEAKRKGDVQSELSLTQQIIALRRSMNK